MLQTFNQLKKAHAWKRDDGLTMLELLTTIAVFGIVAAIASPIIISMIQQAQVDAYKGELSYVADSTEKMINGTFGQPTDASAKLTYEGTEFGLQSLGPRLDPTTGGNTGSSTLGYWFEIGEISLPFDLNSADANIIWQNSRVVRVVPKDASGNFINSATDVMADACITAWVGDTNIVIESLKSSNVQEGVNTAPCGLIPGPLEAPGAPGAPQNLQPIGDGATSSLTISGIDTSTVALGGDSGLISIAGYQVTCTNTGNSNDRIVSGEQATSTMTLAGFTRGADYSCVAQIKTNAYPAFGDFSPASAVVRIPEAPGAPGTLSGTGSGGKISLTLTDSPADDGCNEPGVDDGNTCGTNYGIIDYEVQYVLGVKGTDPATLTDADFATADTITTGSSNLTYELSIDNINAYNAANGTSLTTLVDGNSYYVRTRAVSGYSAESPAVTRLEGAWSNAINEQTATPPDAITGATGEDGVNKITVNFNLPYNGGLPISKLEVWYDIIDTFDGGTTTATGPDGDGTPLGTSSLTIQGEVTSNTELPSTGSAGDYYICYNNSGASLLSGLYRWDTTTSAWAGTCDANGASVTIDQLPDSTSYFVKIFTENAMGLSGWSNEVPVATFAPAEAPTATDATIDNSGNATVTWN